MAISDYSTTPVSNVAISGTDISENCSPAGINDAIRQLMADLATFYATFVNDYTVGVDIQAYDAAIGTVTDLASVYAVTAGTSTAYTLTTGLSLASLPVGFPFLAVFDQECGDDPTLNVDGLGAVALRARRTNFDLVAINARQIRAGASVWCRYNGTVIVCFGDIVKVEDLENVRKSADQAKTSDATIAVDSELVVGLNEIGTYTVEVYIRHSAGAGAFEYLFPVPSGGTLTLSNVRTGTDVIPGTSYTDADTSGAVIGTHIIGSVDMTLAGQNVAFQWSQDTSNAAATTVHEGSYIVCKKI